MIVYGCNLINGNISTMMFENMISKDLNALCKRIEYYTDNDFYDDYTLEELDCPTYIEVVCGNVDYDTYNELLENQDYSAIHDMLNKEVVVYIPLAMRHPYGCWWWKGVS